MGEIQIKYDEVYSKTAEMRNYISADLMTRLNNEYANIQSKLDQMDSGTNARLKDAMVKNRQKTIMVANTLDKLLTFMVNSAKEFERNEKEMADAIASGADNSTGGDK